MRGLIGLAALGVVVGQMGGAGTGGTMEIRGQEVKPGILRLEMGIVPLTGGIHVLGSVKVFAEPSHTLLFAAVDREKLGAGGLAGLVEVLVHGGLQLGNVHLELAEPLLQRGKDGVGEQFSHARDGQHGAGVA